MRKSKSSARPYNRKDRVAELILHELAKIIQKQIVIDNCSLVTLISVDVSRDLSHAKIFFTVLDDTKAKEVVDDLNQKSGYLQSLLGKSISLRVIPKLQFFYDTSIERGRKLSSLIDSLNA